MALDTETVWVTKHLSNNSGSSDIMTKWKFWPLQACSRCGEPKEDADHIHCCKGDGTAAVWEAYLQALVASSVADGLLPAMVDAITAGLNGWRCGT